MVRLGVVAAVAAGTFGAGCGGGEGTKSSTAGAAQAGATKAIAEIPAVRKGLDQAVATYRSGDRTTADTQVGDTYLQHFELVEGPLEKADRNLKARLEASIREKLRSRIKAGAPETEIGRLRGQIDRDLDRAEAALR
jgi:hypothetical protein